MTTPSDSRKSAPRAKAAGASAKATKAPAAKASAGPKRLCVKCNHVRTDYSSAGAVVCNPCKRAAGRHHARGQRLQENYGLTHEDYDKLAKAQGGKCAGCGCFGKGFEAEAKVAGVKARSYFLNVDHDHNLQRRLIAEGIEAAMAARLSVRGLLCRSCNKVLRDVRDNVVRLRRLAEYVLNPPAWKVLRAPRGVKRETVRRQT